jgi:hypothetical protein
MITPFNAGLEKNILLLRFNECAEYADSRYLVSRKTAILSYQSWK